MEVVNSKHVGCYGIVINDNNQVLLIKKARGPYKGTLDLPGGGIEYGESTDETLKREFLEETGLEIKEYKLKTIITNHVTWNMEDYLKEKLQHIAIIYDVKVDNLNLKTDADGEDSLGAEWYNIDDLSIENLSPLAKIIKEK